MKSKSVQVLCAFILLTALIAVFSMATSVYGYLGKSLPFFVSNVESRPLPETLPTVSNPDELIPENRDVLKKVYQRAAEINSLSSLLIQKKGKIVVEDYFKSMSDERAVNIKSVSKSIMSLLIGIALEKGYLRSTGQRIREFFPEYLGSEADARKRNITIEHLLTMKAGLRTTSFDNYGKWVSSDNWIRYVLEQPVVEEPGGDEMVYSTGSSHLLSVILTKASGMSTRAFAQKYLFDPLGIHLGEWDRDPQGYFMGGNNMHLKPSDMVKLGQMVLNGGSYNGKQIVPEKWLIDSFRTYTQSNNNSSRYGYMWWKQRIEDYQVLFACGYGGQYIFIIPELESVVVITSYLRYASDLRRYHRPIFNLLEDTIVPLILDTEPNPERVVNSFGHSGTAVAR